MVGFLCLKLPGRLAVRSYRRALRLFSNPILFLLGYLGHLSSFTWVPSKKTRSHAEELFSLAWLLAVKMDGDS
jgi:hypothetical protein